MEAQDDTMGSKRETHMIIKGKRTKRQRPTSPVALTMASTTTSSTTTTAELSHGSDGVTDNSGNSVEFTKIIQEEDHREEEEEDDMANCLILLAQGQAQKPPPHPAVAPPPNKAAATGYLYECKTCNRVFQSFQALGGHRASHKKPKPTLEEKKTRVTLVKQDDYQGEVCNNNSTTLSLQISPNRALSCIPSINKVNKVHECLICGAEFTSGQALGGHMRRHRTVPMAITTTTSDDHCQEAKKPRTLLSLDLNLPAPEDDHGHREPKFSFGSKDQIIVFSASPLVDCHF